jgi:hypothetical protein
MGNPVGLDRLEAFEKQQRLQKPMAGRIAVNTAVRSARADIARLGSDLWAASQISRSICSDISPEANLSAIR